MKRVWNCDWIKQNLSAFICRETGWWVARWIQTHVFLCSRCRGEYRSLKKVWNHLDEWKIEEPSADMEQSFVTRFRQTFPSAYENRSEPVFGLLDWIPKVVFACVLGILGVSLLYFGQTPLVNRSEVQSRIARTSELEKAPIQKAEQVAQNKEIENHTLGSSPKSSQLGTSKTIPFTQRFRPRIVTTSTLQVQPGVGLYRDVNRSKRPLQINNVPVSDFSSLSSPFEEDHPY